MYPNGALYATKVNKSDLPVRFPPKSDKVISVDFGTSTLVICYITPGSKPYNFKIYEGDKDYYTPTVLLVDENGKVDIGSRALTRYIKFDCDVSKSTFFERVKLELQHDKEVNRNTTVTSVDGEEYYLVEVIATILKFIKERLKDFFKGREDNYKIEDFHWALTVPVLWGLRARDMMREAAYLAGLCSDLPIWSRLLPTPLQPAYDHSPIDFKSHEPDPDKLSLVFEPEAAAVACMELETDPDVSKDFNDCFLIVDIGRRTIDITAHKEERGGTFRMLDVPHGRVCGGVRVNEKFKEFVGQEVFHDPTFSRFLTGSEREEHSAELHGFIFEDFERVKKEFGSENNYGSLLDGSYNISVPYTLATEYRSNLEAIQDKKIEGSTHVCFRNTTQQLYLSKKKMKEFFEPNVIATKECIDEALEKVGRGKVKRIYLVGGLGGCKYMASCIQNHYGPRITVVRSFEPKCVVAQGACLFYSKSFNKVVLRVADATYGTATAVKYDYSNRVHKPAFRITTDNGDYCDNIFQPFIHKGDVIYPQFVYSSTFTPIRRSQTSISFTIYSTLDRYVDFVKNVDGSLPNGLEILGKLKVDISSGMHLPLEDREVQFVLDFSSTEICAYGWFKRNKKPVKTICDFLSNVH